MREMKDSGVEWLGEVPAGWGITPTKHLFFISKTIAGKTGYDVLSVTQHGLKVKDTKSGEGQIAADYSHYQLVEPGDFAMNHMDLLTGWIDIAKQGGVTSPDYRVFKSRTRHMDKRFFLRVFQYYYSGRIFYGFCKGISNRGRWRLPADAFGSICLPVPPLDEQRRIADLLDEKCAQIDRAITSAEQSIQEYKAYGDSLVVCAVNRGLDSGGATRDSGIPAIGQMHSGWHLVAVKRLASFMNGDRGANYPSGDDIRDEGIPFITSADLNGRYLPARFSKYISDEKYASLRGVKLRRGDIVFCLRGSVGKCSLNLTEDEGTIASSLAVARPINCEPEWLNYALACPSTTNQAIATAIGATSANLAANVLSQALIPLPPLDEQRRIADFLDEKCAQIDRAVEAKQAIIDELKSYKKSLIYEVVTGKREV